MEKKISRSKADVDQYQGRAKGQGARSMGRGEKGCGRTKVVQQLLGPVLCGPQLE